MTFSYKLNAHRSLQTRLSVLDFFELFNLALVHVLLQFPSGVFIWQRAPLHQVVDNRLKGKQRENVRGEKGISKREITAQELGYRAKRGTAHLSCPVVKMIS